MNTIVFLHFIKHKSKMTNFFKRFAFIATIIGLFVVVFRFYDKIKSTVLHFYRAIKNVPENNPENQVRDDAPELPRLVRNESVARLIAQINSLKRFYENYPDIVIWCGFIGYYLCLCVITFFIFLRWIVRQLCK